VNEGAPVNGTDKGVPGGEAEVANTKTTEAAETAAEMAETAAKVAETAAKAAVTTPHRCCLIGVRKIDTRKSDRTRLYCCERQKCTERQNGERQRRRSRGEA
jgi:hypothetical protein